MARAGETPEVVLEAYGCDPARCEACKSVALTDGCVIAGWDELGDLSGVDSKPDLRALVEATYPDASPARVANWTGQIWRLIHDMSVGDLVVTPLKKTQEIATPPAHRSSRTPPRSARQTRRSWPT